jgi:galactose oxidase
MRAFGAQTADRQRCAAEMWDPDTEAWSLLDAIATPRTYHSVALLLPDGRVFSGGGGLCGDCKTNHFNGQIFTPSSLLNAARPTITVSSDTAINGGDLVVASSAALSSVCIIRHGSATHATDTDQRRLVLCGAGGPKACGTGTSNTVTVPADAGIALPGHWMVFGLNTAGVPSVSQTVKIGSAPATSVARTAAFAGTTVVGGNAAPITTPTPATPAEPKVPMPPGTQKD